ncbi:MAG: hypothetical protein ACRDE6_03425, partial [Candidatus Limnocylindria bacterium]
MLVLLQLLVFITYIFGPTAAFAEEPTLEPTPTESVSPEVSPDPTTEPSSDPILEPTPAPTAEPTPEPTAAPSEPEATAAPDPTPAPSEPDPTPPVPSVSRAYLVTFASGVSDADQLAALADAGAASESAIPELRMHAAQLSTEAATILGDDARVARIDLDRTREVEAAPSDTSYADQWSLPQVGWDQLYGTVGIAGSATVAVLDTGVDASHPDLDGVVL